MNPTLELLTAEYVKWLDQHNLPQISADELVHEEGLTDSQRRWLANFSTRWVKAERED